MLICNPDVSQINLHVAIAHSLLPLKCWVKRDPPPRQARLGPAARMGAPGLEDHIRDRHLQSSFMLGVDHAYPLASI